MFDKPALVAWREQLVDVAMSEQFSGRPVEVGLESGSVLHENTERVESPTVPENARFRHAKYEPFQARGVAE